MTDTTTGVELHGVGPTVIGPDGLEYRMEFTGTADIVRGPLGRFIDLAAQIEAEGLEVPPAIRRAIEDEQRPKE